MKYVVMSYFLCGLQSVFMVVTWDKFMNNRSFVFKEDIKLLLTMVMMGYLSLLSVIILVVLQVTDNDEEEE